MGKVIKKVEIKIEGKKDGADITVKESATIFITTDEYPEFGHKKGIEIELTDTQKQAIIKHVKDVVLPQAEASK